jgi:prepilin signal peptidase PulO-like enzyme (type II secretory pathway)
MMVGMGFLFGLSSGFVSVFLSFWIGASFILLLFLYRSVVKFLTNKSYNITSGNTGLGWKSEIPFAPFLCLGTAVQFLFQIKLW